jgi:hypothetical protein
MTLTYSRNDPTVRGVHWLWQQLTSQQPRTLRQHLRAYLGPEYERLETHEKSYPGYDLASLNRALASFFTDCCTASREVGGCPATSMNQLLDFVKLFIGRSHRPTAPVYQRVPIDVDQEASFVANSLYLAELRPDAGRNGQGEPLSPDTQRIAILLAVNHTSQGWDGMGTRNAPLQQLTLSVACWSKQAADRFFDEIEERRKRLSIYRGKVIDPVVSAAGICTIGFRAVHKVREDSLVLSDEVRELIQGSIIGFYEHREALRDLGIELKRGILLHGPPGTGKTSIALYLAARLPHFTICFVSGERLLFPREICRMARYLQPAMIVFEDIDLVAHERSVNGLATVLGELMNQIDGCEPSDQILFLMNTNSLDRLEHAVRNRPGRVDQIISIPLPNREQRRRLLTTFAQDFHLATGDLDPVLEATEGVTPALLKEIVKRAAVRAVQCNGARRQDELVPVASADLLSATQQVRALRDPDPVPGTLGFRER